MPRCLLAPTPLSLVEMTEASSIWLVLALEELNTSYIFSNFLSLQCAIQFVLALNFIWENHNLLQIFCNSNLFILLTHFAFRIYDDDDYLARAQIGADMNFPKLKRVREILLLAKTADSLFLPMGSPHQSVLTCCGKTSLLIRILPWYIAMDK